MREKRTKSETTQVFATRLHNLVEGQKIRAVAQGNKLSDGKIADSCGINRPAFNKYLHNDAEIGINSLVKIAKHFDVSTDYLLGLTDASPSALSEREACEATGLTGKALKRLRFLAKIRTFIPVGKDADELKALDNYYACKSDESCIVSPSVPGPNAVSVVQNVEPSRRTVINELLASDKFINLVDTLRSCTAMKYSAYIHKQFNDISPYYNAENDISNDLINDRIVYLELHDALIAVLDDLVAASQTQHKEELDKAIQEYTEQVDAAQKAQHKADVFTQF